MRGRKRAWEEAKGTILPPVPEKKKFVPRFNLPVLQSYQGVFKAGFWAKWKTRKLSPGSTDRSWVSSKALRELARSAGMGDSLLVERVCARLEKGAEIGVEGRGRLPTRMSNSPTVYEHGQAVTDALQEGIADGYLAGPFTQEELEALVGDDFSVNPMSCREKPNGKQRIIVDASAPHDDDESVPGWIYSPEKPGSVNSTIDIGQFPAKMSSVPKFVRTLFRVGRGARICKIDQQSAYKHQHVARKDWKLQVVEWGGRYFLETRLMFGTKSSPGIYDELHKAFLFPVVELTPSFSRRDVEQHLDDVLGVGPGQFEAERSVDAFFRNYLARASEVGFKLDKSGNTEKVQPPGTVCTALGVVFDTEAWTWSLKADKLARMNHTLHRIVQGDELEYREVQSIIGKLIDIKSLVQGGKYNLQYFLRLASLDVGKSHLVRASPELQRQARWWMIALAVVDKGSPIVHPDVRIPSNAVIGYTDAAGGSWDKVHTGNR